jgi:phytoene dehydrogenase-like protein
VAEATELGVTFETGHTVASLAELPPSRAVVLDVTPRQVLAIAGDRLPAGYRRGLERYRYGPGVFKVDWALDGPVPWSADAARRSAVVHVGDSLDDLSRFTREVRDGRIPERPYLVIGQQSVADPSRAPAGGHTLWAYTRVPSKPEGGWAARADGLADAIDARIEELAPGFRARILARRIVSPERLEAMDANLVGGDLGGGSNAWNRQLMFRPVFPWFRYRLPVDRLYLCSSYAHPGAGVHGMCGFNAAHRVVEDLG